MVVDQGMLKVSKMVQSIRLHVQGQWVTGKLKTILNIIRIAVLLSRPSKDGFARLDGRLGKIARLTPVFL